MANQDPSRASKISGPELARLNKIAEEANVHLRRGRVDLARAPIAELLRALPADDSVRILATQAVVVAFDWPLERRAATPAPREPPSLSNLDLVSFHVDLPRTPSGVHQAIDYGAVLALTFESAAIKAPSARRILLTDETTQLPAGLPVDEVVRFALDREKLMYERMRVQSIYLERREPGRCSVLIDSDVVVNTDPTRVFSEAFDIGLTWRNLYPDAPFNGGMILVAEGAAGLHFFRKARECYDALADDPAVAGAFADDLRAWWGDQFALAATVGYRAYGQRTTDLLSVDGVRVRFFPCETHNFTFEPGRSYAIEELKRKLFIHFKGNRKGLQASYLEALRSGRI